jgi:predicted ATPase/transcriptional regulator with XRE-family HTH domain
LSPSDDNPSFGYWLRRRRKALDLTQARLAQLVGCAVATIKKLEADERRPSLPMAERLADCLAVPAEERAAFLRVARAEVSLHRQGLAPPDDVSISEARASAAALAPHHTHVSNLPVAANRLVGRHAEVAALRALLARTGVRLVTLTGPGGIGKTRLAVQAAEEIAEGMALACWFVDLSPVLEAPLVLPAIAQALDVQPSADQEMLDTLKHFFQQRQALLVLDNFEHLVEAAPQVGALQSAARGLKILVTSRVVLHLAGEYEFSVPALPVPPMPEPSAPGLLSSAPADLAAMAQYASVALLLERAAASGAPLALTPENAADIAAICRQLEGLPLAIELAAARCKLFAPKELLARLADRLHILTMGPRDRPPRHQTLRATLDWSYQLLPPGVRILFARLSVFVGGFTLDAAESVCRTPSAGSPGLGASPQDFVDSITLLLDHSMLRPGENTGGTRRFLMLETLREYAHEKLVAQGEDVALGEQHASYFLALAEQAEPLLWSAQQHVWYQRLIAEQSNFRAALYWWRSREVYAQVARLGAALCWFWLKHGDLRAGMPLLEWVLAETERQHAAAPPSVRVKALYSVASGASWLGDTARARRLFEECLEIEEASGSWPQVCSILGSLAEINEWEGNYPRALQLNERYLAVSRAHGFTQGMADALNQIGELLRLQGDYARAIQVLRESLVLRKVVGTVTGVAATQGYLGIALYEVGELDEAQQLLADSLQLSYALDDKMMVAGVLAELGVVAQLRGDYATAEQYQRDALTLLDELGFQTHSALALARLGNLALLQDDLAAAHGRCQESMLISQRIGSKRSLIAALEGAAGVAVRSERARQAALILGAAQAYRRQIGLAHSRDASPVYEQTLALARAALGASQFEDEYSMGQQTALDEAINLALGAPYS